MIRTLRPALALALALLFATAPAAAQDYDTGVPSAVEVSASATAVTDYRFRGLSRTGEDPAVQGRVAVRHESGLSASLFASTLAGSDGGGSVAGARDVELQLGAAYARRVASGLTAEAGATYYLYPGNRRGRATDFVEPYAALSYDLGPLRARASAAYAPSAQAALGDRDNLYLAGDLTAGVPTTPVTLTAHLGRANGGIGRVAGVGGDYWDWSVGAEAVAGPFVIGARYVDTDVRPRLAEPAGADATALAFVGVRF